MSPEITIRTAVPADAPALLEIYAPYVRETAITFEYDVPSVAEFSGRIRAVLEKYPYLVAERGVDILGYAYAGAFKGRAAYDWDVETTVYIRKDQKRLGIGRRLYSALEDALRAQGIVNMYACIAVPEEPDEYLTADSVAFHTRMGFQNIGIFRFCGFKFNRWYHMVWMEKQLREHSDTPSAIQPFAGL